MSEADQWRADVTAHGVQVKKVLNLDDYSVPSLVFTIRGPSDGAATVRVRDPIPDDVGAGDVGFHPKHGGEFWTFDGDAVTFSRRFEPGETYTTVYGLVDVEPDSDGQLRTEPSVELLDGDGGSSLGGTPPSGDVTDGDGLLGRLARELEAEEYDTADRERIREALLDDPGRASDGRAGGGAESREAGDPVAADADSVAPDVVELTSDLESMRDRVEALERDAERRPPGEVESLRERLDALESDTDEDDPSPVGVESMRAYVDDLAADVRGDFEDEIGGIRQRVDAIEEALDAPEGQPDDLAPLEERVSALEADVDGLPALREEVATMGDRVDDLADERESAAADEVEAIRDSVDELHAAHEALEEDVQDARAGVRRNGRDIDDVGGEVAELVATIESLPAASEPDAERLAALEDEVERMAGDLDSLGTFSERLSETLLDLDTQ